MNNGVTKITSILETERLMKIIINLDRIADALEKQNEIRDDSVEEYRKILTDKKVAKIFVAEEKFRRQHIRRLHERPGEKK